MRPNPEDSVRGTNEDDEKVTDVLGGTAALNLQQKDAQMLR